METLNFETKNGVALTANEKLIMALRLEADKNQAFNAVCKVFADRERSRQQITVISLKAAMKKHGFDFAVEQYEEILKVLARAGIGHLDKSPKGRIRALKGIKVTLQSVGKAALSNGTQINNFRPQVKFMKIPQAINGKKTAENYKVSFTIELNAKSVVFEVPGGVQPDKLGEYLAKALKA